MSAAPPGATGTKSATGTSNDAGTSTDAGTASPPATPAHPADPPPPVAERPPVDPEILFAPPVAAEPSLSPDGLLLAWRRPREGGELAVRLADAADGEIAVPAADGGAGEVLDWGWGVDRRLWVVRRRGDGSSLQAVELAAPLPDGRPSVVEVRSVFAVEAGELELGAVAAGPPERALVALRRPAAGESVLFAVEAGAAPPVELARGGADVERWLIDPAGMPRAAALRQADGSWRLARVAGGGIGDTVIACTAEESCRALAVDEAGRVALASDFGGAASVGLTFVDLADGSLRRLPTGAANPAAPSVSSNAVAPSSRAATGPEPRDLGGVLFAEDGTLLASWPAGEPRRLHAHDAAFAEGWQRLAPLLPEGPVEPVAVSRDRRRWPAVAAGAALLLDLDAPAAGAVRRVLDLHPGWQPAPRRSVSYRARDGLTIPALLTLPPRDAEQPTAPLPAVVLPPDDPWRPRRGDPQPLVELLADRGYAVLQPSPRGSAGFGRAFRAAGERQWGGAMLDDLADGVRWLIGEGIADAERVAIVGFGWGGYAAVASLAFTPDLYAAGVAVDGPVDLRQHLADAADEPLRAAVLLRRIGDPAIHEQRERLLRHSPLSHAGAIRAPLLRIDLEDGPWSDPEGSERLVDVLRRLERPVEAFAVGGGEGGSFEGAAGLAVAVEVERFLAFHLGR